jgi:hypothetical protein
MVQFSPVTSGKYRYSAINKDITTCCLPYQVVQIHFSFFVVVLDRVLFIQQLQSYCAGL